MAAQPCGGEFRRRSLTGLPTVIKRSETFSRPHGRPLSRAARSSLVSVPLHQRTQVTKRGRAFGPTDLPLERTQRAGHGADPSRHRWTPLLVPHRTQSSPLTTSYPVVAASPDRKSVSWCNVLYLEDKAPEAPCSLLTGFKQLEIPV
jgi:hypothetical protein